MVFSIRELIVLTVYCSLLLTNIQWILVILLIAAHASSIVMAILFGFASFTQLFIRKEPEKERPFLVPLMLLVLFAILPTLVLVPLRISSVEFALALDAGKYLGLVSGSIPLLMMLDSRFTVVNARLLWVGYWALLFAAIGGAVGVLVASLSFESVRGASDVNIARIAAFGGLVGSVSASWLLSPRKRGNIYGEEYDD